ncbi:MAG: UDP-N-acetylglucosamine 2-epimerase (non-hydrolyzing) [Gemmatimonadaceae bacterium]
MKLASVVGARPNFMKLAPLATALDRRPGVEHFVIHTGQHYDAAMSDTFFRELRLPDPRYHLAVGSGSHAQQTAAIMERIEPILADERPDIVIVYGDVNSTVAAALTAAKLNLTVAHVEAGLRSRDRTMPEEVNRIVTDSLATILLAPSPDAVSNLRAEGHDPHEIHFVGNIMIDVLRFALGQAQRPAGAPNRDGDSAPYVVATIHRPANVDDPVNFQEIMGALLELSEQCPVVFPVHPRTRQRLEKQGIYARAAQLRLSDPLPYLEMTALVAGANLVVTDSGGLQEETTYLGIPCLTVRSTTERPITCTEGTNRLVAANRDVIVAAAREALARPLQGPPIIDRWDGCTGERIAAVLCGDEEAAEPTR